MDFEIKPMAMISGSHEAEVRRYRKYEFAGGVYLVAIQDACADNVYFHDPKAKNSQGFAGRTLRFELEDGSFYDAQGPWKCGAKGLNDHCGVDITDKYSSYVVIGKDMKIEKRNNSEGYVRIIKDVIYQDDGWQVGPWNREKEILKRFPAGKYYYYTETAGGSSSGPIEHNA